MLCLYEHRLPLRGIVRPGQDEMQVWMNTDGKAKGEVKIIKYVNNTRT